MIWSLIIGLVIGAVAKFLMPGKDPGGIIITIIIGIVGSTVAGWIGSSINFYKEGEPVGFIASVLGSMLLLYIYRLAVDRKS